MSDEKKTCGRCNGSGTIPCPGCQGSGQQIRSIKEGFRNETKIVNCSGCSGKGITTCGVCGGSGNK